MRAYSNAGRIFACGKNRAFAFTPRVRKRPLRGTGAIPCALAKLLVLKFIAFSFFVELALFHGNTETV